MSTTGDQRPGSQASLHDLPRSPPWKWISSIPRGVHEAVPGTHAPEGVPVPVSGPQGLFKRRCGNCLICLERDLRMGIWLFPRESDDSAPSTHQETASKDAPSTQGAAPSKDAPSTQEAASSKDAPSTRSASSKEPPATQSKDPPKDLSTTATQQGASKNTPPTVRVQTVLSKEKENSDWSNRLLDVMDQIKPIALSLEELAKKNWRAPGLPGGKELVEAQSDLEKELQKALRTLGEFDFGGEVVVLGGSGATKGAGGRAGAGRSAAPEERALLPKAAAQFLLGRRAYGGIRPATLQDVRDILLSDPERARLRQAEYDRVHEALANLYESCLPPLEDKYGKRPEDRDNWWWGGRLLESYLINTHKYQEGCRELRWRVAAQEQVKFVYGLENQKNVELEENRFLFLLVGEDGKKRAAVPSPLIKNSLDERDFLVRERSG